MRAVEVCFDVAILVSRARELYKISSRNSSWILKTEVEASYVENSWGCRILAKGQRARS